MRVSGPSPHFRDKKKKKSAKLANFSKAHRYLELSPDGKMDFSRYGAAFAVLSQTAEHSKTNLIQDELILPTCILEFIGWSLP